MNAFRFLALGLGITALVITASAPATTAATRRAARPTSRPPVTTVAKPIGAAPAPQRSTATLRISAIPDVTPDRLQEINATIATYLARKLDVKVEYVPVADYPAAVSLFRTGDLDLVWFGGLTGVQARLLTPGSTVLAQRDIDDDFHSVFVVNAAAARDLPRIDSVAKLAFLKGLRFTYGSESSTSGRTMPEYFLNEAGLDPDQDFSGRPGFSGSHDKTIDLVQSGSFEAGVLNEQVWARRKAAGTVDLTKVVEVFRSPGYRDYHWLSGPATDKRFGVGFNEHLKAAFLSADADPGGAKALALLGAKKFIPTSTANYAQIEKIGRRLALIG